MSEWPNLRTLELLREVAATGSLTRAAARVGMAQPNASRAIHRLEDHLRLQLLDRSPGGSSLTADGRLVAEWAAPVLAAADAWRSGSTALVARRPRSLDVVASQTVAEYLAPRWIAIYHARHPEETVTLRVHNSARVLDLIRSGRCSLGFVETPSVPTDLPGATVVLDRLCVVVSPGHPWARRTRPIPVAELAATPLVVREPGSGTRDTYAHAVAGLPVAPPALVLSSNAAVLGSAAVGAAPAVLSQRAVAGAVAAGSVVVVPVVPDEALTRPLRAVWPAGDALDPRAAELLAIARTERPLR